MTYQQGPHLQPDDNEHFGPGRNWCRDCYRAYAKDWRERRRDGATSTRVPRTARASVMDGVAALDDVLQRAGYPTVVHAIAEHTTFLAPEVVAQTRGEPLFASIRNQLRRRQFDTLPDGRRVLLDDNTTPTDAYLWSAGLKKGPDVQFNHVWTASKDVQAYTALWNIVATPSFLAKTTDSHPRVIEALKFRAFDLYGFRPAGAPEPPMPPGYTDLVWAAHPPAIVDLESELRGRMRAKPKSPEAIAAREIGWLFSDWKPDPTI